MKNNNKILEFETYRDVLPLSMKTFIGKNRITVKG